MVIDGVPVQVKDGTFYVEWRRNGKRIQKAVGKNGHEAIEAWGQQCQIHSLRATGIEIKQDATGIATVSRHNLAEVVDGYLAKPPAAHSSATRKKYREVLEVSTP